jgi:ketosteroid isomerase-like protein
LGPAEFKAGLILGDFAQADNVQSKFTWMSVSASGPVAWVAADMYVSAEIKGQTRQFKGRFTAVLERVMGRWFIMQSHFSLPAADQAEGHSFPAR